MRLRVGAADQAAEAVPPLQAIRLAEAHQQEAAMKQEKPIAMGIQAPRGGKAEEQRAG